MSTFLILIGLTVIFMEIGLARTTDLDLDTGKIAGFGFTITLSLIAAVITYRALGRSPTHSNLVKKVHHRSPECHAGVNRPGAPPGHAPAEEHDNGTRPLRATGRTPSQSTALGDRRDLGPTILRDAATEHAPRLPVGSILPRSGLSALACQAVAADPGS